METGTRRHHLAHITCSYRLVNAPHFDNFTILVRSPSGMKLEGVDASGIDVDALPEHYQLKFLGRPSAKSGHIASIVGALTLEAPRWIARPKFKHFMAKENSVHLGSLDLPTEILRMIILQLDLISLRAFANSNTHFLRVLRNTPEYHHLVEGAPQFCYLLVKTQLARHFALDRIYFALKNSECAVCRSFASHVFLPGMQRCCPRCLAVDPEFRPITPTIAQRQYGVPKKSIDELPILETLPGKYSKDDKSVQTFTKKRRLISRMEARRLGTQKGKDLRWGKALTWSSGYLYYELERNMCITYLGVLDVKGSRIEYGLHCRRCAFVAENHWQCQFGSPGRRACGQHSLPLGIDVETKDHSSPPHHGIKSCTIKIDAIRLYSKQTLLQHVQNCQSAKLPILEGMLLSHTRVVLGPIWSFIVILLPRLFWSIESYLDEDAPKGIIDVPQADNGDRKADKLEEAIWKLYWEMLRASERMTGSRPDGLTVTLGDLLRDSPQASGVLGDLRSLKHQAMECEAECLGEGDPQKIPGFAAVRERFATMVTRLGGLLEGLCPRSDEDLVDGSEDDAKPHVGGSYNLRSSRRQWS